MMMMMMMMMTMMMMTMSVTSLIFQCFLSGIVQITTHTHPPQFGQVGPFLGQKLHLFLAGITKASNDDDDQDHFYYNYGIFYDYGDEKTFSLDMKSFPLHMKKIHLDMK